MLLIITSYVGYRPCKRSWKSKAQSLYHLELFSPTEKIATGGPETTHQQSHLYFHDFLTSSYVAISDIRIIYAYIHCI